MLPEGEEQSAIITEEMAFAWGVARQAGDRVSARMAFLAVYRRVVSAARDLGTPPKWFPSLGTDPRGREEALSHAHALGRISAPHARALTCGRREIAPEVACFATTGRRPELPARALAGEDPIPVPAVPVPS